MKKKLIDFKSDHHLSHNELYQIKGGRVRRGPEDLVDVDIDIPDLTLSAIRGPGELVDDDVDIPDLTLGAITRRSFKKRFHNRIIC